MKKWIKIISSFIGILLLVAIVFYQMYLTARFVDQPDLSNLLQNTSITINNTERSFHWYAPKETENINTILYVLHGSRSNGIEVRKSTAYEFDKIADEQGLIVIYPTGFENHWNDCRASADYSANTNNIDDFSFFQAIEIKLKKEHNILFTNRFATGHSNGGHLCYKLALEHPEWIDGIAPISANLPINANLDCNKTETFVPICLINGTADKVNPYDGGLVQIMGNNSRGTVLSTEETLQYWTSLTNCSAPNTTRLEDKITDDNSTVRQTIWVCDDKVQAINYQIVNGGHVIPHPKNRLPKIFGKTNQDINAPQVIWSFFKELKT